MKKRTIFSFIFLLSILNTAGASIRTKYNFNPDWKLFIGNDSTAKNVSYDDSKWKSVNLPATFNEKNALDQEKSQLTDEVAWYRKKFSVPSEHKGEKIFIEFEGASQKAEIWINGKKVGLQENGSVAFGFDVTDFIVFGNKKDNVIAVRINKGNAGYGGLTRNVFLHFTDKLYQTLPLYNNLKTKGIYVYADNYDIKGKRAVLHIESEVRNDYDGPKTIKLNVIVRDNDKLLIREFQSEEVTLQPGETKVVTANASMKNLQFWSWGYGYQYEVNTSITIGKKVIDMVRTKTGFRKTEFKNGMFKLNDRVLQFKGYAQNSTNEWPGVGSSVPSWLSDYSNKQMLECNANLVRWTHNTPSKQDVESCDRIGLMEAIPVGDKDLMRDAIIYNRNNPSIIFYECENSGTGESEMAEMSKIKNELDSKGGRVIGANGMMDSQAAEYSGDVDNVIKSAGKPFWTMEYGSVFNQNPESNAIENVNRWFNYWNERPGTGRRVSSGAVKSSFSDSNNQGSENGDVNAIRIKKEAWWADFVMWDGWVDPENFHSHIVGHWNYEKGDQRDVQVISTGDKVELFLNNKSLGFGVQTNRFLFTFKNVAYQPGELRAVSYDKNKQMVSETACRTIGAPKSLKLNLIQDPDGLYADGSDLILVEVEVLDAAKKRCPLANNRIDFVVNGPVDFIGGIAQGEKNVLNSKSLPVEAGVNRILLRSNREAGIVTIIAKSGDLIQDTLRVTSQAVDVVKGLSSYIPGTKLSTNLSRGETPLTGSYTVSRIPVSVMGVTAGSNEKEAFFSFDDNEKSEWKSNEKQSDAWIEYELSRESELSEISLKLTGWMTNSYPIRVLNNNGIVLWEGNTDKSFGYINLPLKKGEETKSVRIEINKNSDQPDKNMDSKKISLELLKLNFMNLQSKVIDIYEAS